MKKYIFIFSAVSLLFLSSCEGFLTETPTTSLQTGLYDSEEALESQIYGILGRFYGSTTFTGEGMEFLNLSGPILHHGMESSVTRNVYYQSLLQYTQYSTSSKNQNFFRNLFNIINACNVLLANLEASPVEDSYKKEIEAETRFYRAYIYFRIVRTWGDAPIRNGLITNETVNAKRDPYYKVYEFIVNDLNFAAEFMRRPERVESVAPLKSRVNKYAATALLSTVYCTIGSLLTSPDDNFWDNTRDERMPDFSPIGISCAEDAYSLALKHAEILIPGTANYDAGCTYRLADNYADLFRWDSESFPEVYTLPERVFVLPITKSFGNRNVTLPEYTLPPYAEGTEYRDDLVSTGKGRWRVDRWTYQHWCEDYPGNKGTGKCANIYDDSADPRFNLTFYHTEVFNEQKQSYTKVYPHPDKIGSNPGSGHSYPYLRKYWSKRYSADSGEADIYLMRYAEVYLNAIEAAAELNDIDKAYAYMDVLHARARKSVADGMPESPMPKWEAGKYTTIEQLRTQIFWERIYEYVGEMHEFDEMHRHGATWMVENLSKPMNEFLKLPEQKKLFNPEKNVFYPKGDGFEYETDVNEIRKGLLWDYPATELNYNDALLQSDQNDYTFGI